MYELGAAETRNKKTKRWEKVYRIQKTLSLKTGFTFYPVAIGAAPSLKRPSFGSLPCARVSFSMPKRFTDTEKWKDEWFLSLDNDKKAVWQYLLDNCTPAGRFKKNLILLNFCCRTSETEESLSQWLAGRIIDRGNFYFIPKFVKYQNPKGLNSNKPAILAIRAELKEYSLETIIKESFGNDYLIINQSYRDRKGIGKGKGKKRGIVKGDDGFLESLKKTYAWVDTETELKKIDGWILAHPGRKKTRRFIINWFNKVEKPFPPQKPAGPQVNPDYLKEPDPEQRAAVSKLISETAKTMK